MADTRGTRDTRSRAGWVWVIVGIVAVGLIIWWIAAAVDDDQGAYEETGEVTAVEETEGVGGEGAGIAQGEQQEGEQIFDDQNGLFEEENEQAERSGQMLGEAPSVGEFEEPEGVQEFSQWNQEQQQAEVNQDYVNEGTQRLGDAVDGMVGAIEEQQPQQGQQVGGGPSQQQLQQQQQQFEQSVNQLEQAQEQEQPQAFHEAANNLTILLSTMAQQVGADRLNQPIEDLRQSVHQIQPNQPLAQQEQQVRGFFSQAEQVLSQMSQNLQQGATGGGPVQQQDQQQPQQQHEGMTQ